MTSFDEVLELYSLALTRGADGQKIETYTLSATVFGHVTPLHSDNVFDDNQEVKISATVDMYKRTDLTARWRVKWSTKMFDITSIDMGERISPLMKLTIAEV